MSAVEPLHVVIVSTDDGHWLGPCLDSLERSHFNRFQVTLVMNDCTDETASVAKASSLRLNVIQTMRRLRFAAANNLALSTVYADGHCYFLLLNPDTRVHPEALGELVDFLSVHQEYGIAGSWQAEYGDATWNRPNQWCREVVMEADAMGNHPRLVGSFHVLDHYYVQGAALALRASLLPRVGLLDPVYGTFYEETDFCRRVLWGGWRVGLLYSSRVQHEGGGNWKKSRHANEERDHLFLRNQFLFEFSNPLSSRSTSSIFWAVLRKQVNSLRCGEKDLVMPMWKYPRVLVSMLFALRYLRMFHARNRIIRAQMTLDPDLWSVG